MSSHRSYSDATANDLGNADRVDRAGAGSLRIPRRASGTGAAAPAPTDAAEEVRANQTPDAFGYLDSDDLKPRTLMARLNCGDYAATYSECERRIRRISEQAPGKTWTVQYGFKNGVAHSGVAVMVGEVCVFWYELNIKGPGMYMHDEPLQNTITTVPADMVLVLRMAQAATDGWRTIRSTQGKPYNWSGGTLCHDFTEFMAASFGHDALDHRGQLRGPWSASKLGRTAGKAASAVLGAPIDLYGDVNGQVCR